MTTDVAADAPDLGESALVYQLPIGGPDEMLAWVESARRGDRVVYFIGHLAIARDLDVSPFGAKRARRADRVADVAACGSRDGLLQLTQTRVAEGCFLYVARRA